jgi:hypothetical protein
VSSYLRLAKRSGIGLGALFLYSFLITSYYQSILPIDSGASVAAVAVIAPFIVWTASKQFNKQLVKLIAEEKVAEAYIQIKFHQGSKEFYNEYSEDIREELDNLDKKFHYQVVNILSGTVIATTAPILAIIEFAKFGYFGVVFGLGVSLVVGYALGVASYRKIIEILDYSTRISKVTNET